MAARKSTKPKKVVNNSRRETPEKPMFRTGTWVMVILFAALVGFSYLLKNQKEASTAEATPPSETSFVFDSAEGTLTSIEIKPADGLAVKVTRNEEGIWAMQMPEQAEADQGTVEAAASQIESLRVINQVEGDPSIFGFDDPGYEIIVEFGDGEKHTLEVGDNTPTNSGYYIRLDGDKMLVVGLSGIDSLTNLALFPPYLSTPTPLPPPTEAPASVEATVTPIP